MRGHFVLKLTGQRLFSTVIYFGGNIIEMMNLVMNGNDEMMMMMESFHQNPNEKTNARSAREYTLQHN